MRRQAGFALCHASLPESRGYLFTARVPRQFSADLRAGLALGLPAHVPLAPAETVFDGEIIPEESTSEEIGVAAVAFPEGLALAYARAFEESGFLPLSFELEPQAAARAMVQGSAADSLSFRSAAGAPAGATIIIDFGEAKTILCVVENGQARFTTSGEGSEGLDRAFAAQGWDARHIARHKIDVGLVGESAVQSEFSQAAEKLAADIRRLATYWNARGRADVSEGEPTLAHRARIERAILYGGNANIKGLAEYLSRAVGFTVEYADIWRDMGIGGRVYPLPRNESVRFGTVAGLAMRGIARMAKENGL